MLEGWAGEWAVARRLFVNMWLKEEGGKQSEGSRRMHVLQVDTVFGTEFELK